MHNRELCIMADLRPSYFDPKPTLEKHATHCIVRLVNEPQLREEAASVDRDGGCEAAGPT